MASKHACCGKGERPLAAGGEPPDLSVASQSKAWPSAPRLAWPSSAPAASPGPLNLAGERPEKGRKLEARLALARLRRPAPLPPWLTLS